MSENEHLHPPKHEPLGHTPDEHDPDEHGGRVRKRAAMLGMEPEELLDFSANVNFLGPTLPVLAAARRAIDEMAWYPQDPPTPLRRAAAAYLRVPEDGMLMGNGASELISLVVASLRPERVLTVEPTFAEYARTARAWGAEVDRIETPEDDNFALTPQSVRNPGVAERIRRADLVCLCDPNNPTGGLIDREVRTEIIRLAEDAGTWVLVDESFLGFTQVWPEGSAISLGSERVMVVHSLTKILALPGLRVGAAILPQTAAEPFRRRLPPWNVNCVAQAAALAALSDEEMLARTPRETEQRRNELAEGLEALPLVETVLPGEANFLCLRLAETAAQAGGHPTRINAERVADLLLRRHGVLVRDLSRFPGMGSFYIRVAVKDHEENERLLSAFGQISTELTAPASPAGTCEGMRKGDAS